MFSKDLENNLLQIFLDNKLKLIEKIKVLKTNYDFFEEGYINLSNSYVESYIILKNAKANNKNETN